MDDNDILVIVLLFLAQQGLHHYWQWIMVGVQVLCNRIHFFDGVKVSPNAVWLLKYP